MANQSGGVIRIVRALRYSWLGITAALRHEAAFRQEALLVIIGIIVACCLNIDLLSRALLIGTVWLVLIVELLNSAIEAVVDRAGTEWHELAGRAKDMGSAAVLLSLVLACVIWGMVLWNHWFC